MIMGNIGNINFEDIKIIANYIDGNITNKTDKSNLVEKLKKNKDFRESYTEAYEYLKNLEHQELNEVPANIQSKVKKNSNSDISVINNTDDIKDKKLVVKLLKNIVEIVSNTIEYIKPKELTVEYLSTDDNKVVNQKFALGKGIIEIKSSEKTDYAELIIESQKNTDISLQKVIENRDNTIIAEMKAIDNITKFTHIDKGLYYLKVDNDFIYLEIV
ncbi:MAG: hypothetical protein ACOCV8_03470 [Spirochaetota bacterium]